MSEIVAAVAQQILADDPPPSEATTPTAGTAPKARRHDARNMRLTSSTYHPASGANGTTRVVFTRPFAKRPNVDGTVIEKADNGPVTFKVVQYLKSDGSGGYVEWTDADQTVGIAIVACDLFGYRVNPNTPTASFTLLTLTTFLFSGVNAALTQIVNAVSGKPTTTPLPQGTPFTCLAVASSEP